jgi:dipeptidyl aminopeptidase/acylaminoacyl peptidase
LFVYTVSTRTLTQLTADAYADLQPAWSPDGETIAVVTDRFTSSLRDLRFGAFRVGLLDVASGVIRPATDASPGSKQVSPQWAPDGETLYFVSDRSGISNVYRLALDSGALRQVTFVSGGVSGITGVSPSLAVASRTGMLAFSVYRNGRYEIQSLQADRTLGSAPAATAEPTEPDADAQLPQLLADAEFGLPDGRAFTLGNYDDRLHIEAWSPPYISAATGSSFGGLIRASFGFSLGDTLRDRQLETMFRVGSARDDFAVQTAYSNRRGQWTWGALAGFSPSRFVGARRTIARADGLTTRETTNLRYENHWASFTSRFDMDRSRRLEFRAGVRRTGYEWQTIGNVFDTAADRTIGRSRTEAPGGDPVYLAEGQLAFVQDTSVSGPVSPILGQRLRLEVDPAVGGLVYAGVLVDARRYLMPIRPVTIAIRLQHNGRYGPGANDPRLTPLFMGMQSLVRGYNITGYAADKCGRTATDCSLVDQLAGSRFGLANVELRAPLGGLLTGDLDYGRLPVEALIFAEAAVLWTHAPGRNADRDQFRSLGAGARVNLGGVVLEMTAAKPVDSSAHGWRANLLIGRGF